MLFPAIIVLLLLLFLAPRFGTCSADQAAIHRGVLTAQVVPAE